MKTGSSLHSWRTCIGLIVTALLVFQSAIPLNKLSVQAAPLRATTYPCDIEVSYTGMDTTHVAYDANGCDSNYVVPGWTTADLMVTVNGSTTTLLSGVTSGTYRHTGLPLYADVDYSFRFNYPASPPVDSGGFAYSSTTVGSMGGTLLFDETVTIPAVSQNTWVIIPAGLTMELDYGTYDAVSVAQFEVQPGGTLTLDHMETNGGYFKSPETPQDSLIIRNCSFLSQVKLAGAAKIT